MRCQRMNGTWSEDACIKYQDSGRQECKGCKEGEELREDLGLPPLVVNPVPNPETKYCSKCRETKPRDQFSPDQKSKDRLRGYCKSYTAELARGYQQKKKGLPAAAADPKPSRRKAPAVKRTSTPGTVTAHADITAKLLEVAKEKIRELSDLFRVLEVLKEYGATFEMPGRVIE